jgi:hypothetical protein
MLFDEYGFAAARGEKEAIDKFFADKPESPMTLPTGQALVLKVPGQAKLERERMAANETGRSAWIDLEETIGPMP